MSLLAVLFLGVLIGAAGGAGIYFAKEEPYKTPIFLATMVRGGLVSLLTAYAITPGGSWLRGAALGGSFGLATGLVVFLAKGGFRGRDARYILPSSLVTGALTGILLVLLQFQLP
jgi:hypothetical protein